MGTQKNGIIILGIILALVVVLFVAFRNFKLGDIFGLGKVQEDFDKFAKGVEDNFKNFSDWLFQVDPHSSIAGETVTDTGLEVTIPDDTIVNDDGTVTSSTSPTFELSQGDIAKTRALFENDDKLTPILQKRVAESKLTQQDFIDTFGNKEGLSSLFDSIPRDADGFASVGFRPREIDLRSVNVIDAKKRNAFRNIKTGKVIQFGGFESAQAQELELRKEFEKNRKLHPQFFANTPENFKKKTKVK